jgi:hypothetical protein
VRFPLAVIVAALIASVVTGCSHDARPNPKETITLMFEAMRNSDSVSLALNIDLPVAAASIRNELPQVQDTSGGEIDWGAVVLSEMVGDGGLRKRWLDEHQIVLGRAEVTGDTALVEVSFLDRVTRVQYYNKMELVYRGDRWIVTRFRTL